MEESISINNIKNLIFEKETIPSDQEIYKYKIKTDKNEENELEKSPLKNLSFKLRYEGVGS